MNRSERLRRETYLGLFFIALSSLMLEVILLRIFSAVMLYHFVFLCISLALFGIGASGIYVYLFPHLFPVEKVKRQLALVSLLFSISIIISFSIFLGVSFVPRISFPAVMSLAVMYSSFAVPFFFAGLCFTLAFKHYACNIAKLYFYDLLGAGIGCLLVIVSLFYFDGPSIIILIAFFASIASLFFSLAGDRRKFFKCSLLLNLALFIFFVTNSAVVKIFYIDFVDGVLEKNIIYEKWSPVGRVNLEDKTNVGHEYGKHAHHIIKIDTGFWTPMFKINKDYREVSFLLEDPRSLVYHLKRNAKVLIFGSGGGLDVLNALLTNQKEIQAVEVNPVIVDIVKNKYKDFNGNIYNDPKVKVMVDEARSFIRKSNEKYDIIQSTHVDTINASTSGAFTFTENHIYTVEAFIDYYKHLNDDGIICFERSRVRGLPEVLRLTSIVLEALQQLEIEMPERHLVVTGGYLHGWLPMGNVLIKKSPFSPEDLEEIRRACKRVGMEILYSPFERKDNSYNQLIHSTDVKDFLKRFPLDISPPTDDKPFYFHYTKFKDYFNFKKELKTITRMPTFLLESLLIIVFTLTMMIIILPLLLLKRVELKDNPFKGMFITYFSCIGLGFIMVEIPLIGKSILFLGQPFYATAVVLSSLLIFSGIGSYLSSRIGDDNLITRIKPVLLLLPLVIIIYLFVLPKTFTLFLRFHLYFRFLITIGLIAPLGILMGMPFPTGIRLVEKQSSALIPWLWGINGACSVLSSVFSWVIAINFGFNLVFILAMLIYFIAFLTIVQNKLKVGVA